MQRDRSGDESKIDRDRVRVEKIEIIERKG